MQAKSVINGDVIGILCVPYINDMQGFVEEVSSKRFFEREIEEVTRPVALQDEDGPARALNAELEAGSGSSRSRLTVIS